MSLRSDQKALMFVGAIAVLGTGVRAVRAAARSSPQSQPALETQARAADSSARAQPARAEPTRTRRAGESAQQDTTHRSPRGRRRTHGTPTDTVRRALPPARTLPMDRKGYVNGRLDLDVATAAQIDSLPGVGPQLAKRIVLDRMQRGPFVNRDGLRRVSGVGPNLAQRIDSLVAFSGTVHWPEPGDTILPMRARRRP